VLVDPKGANWKRRYAGATVLKPNWREAQMTVATRDSSVMALTPTANDADAEQLAGQIRAGVGVRNVILTRGQFGVSLAAEDGSCLSFKSRAKNVRDEAGAGDVLAAVTTLALAGGAPLPLATWLGNLAASIKVAKFGTLAISDHEILEALGEHHPASYRKLLTAPQAAEFAAAQRKSGKKVVFTNGCFDILHLGHVTLLERARALGDALIVALNTDASVRRLKGPQRPVNPQTDRSRVISSLACVDAVVLFDEDTPMEVLKVVKPDILCKGGDYKSKQEVVGWELVEGYGGQIALIDLVEGRSTSNLIDKMRDSEAPPTPKLTEIIRLLRVEKDPTKANRLWESAVAALAALGIPQAQAKRICSDRDLDALMAIAGAQ
jgi:D-beta-D-heptose 7-phosphate kinase / D-beta-D-heptose 1-phosphate adenosyltransferase